MSLICYYVIIQFLNRSCYSHTQWHDVPSSSSHVSYCCVSNDPFPCETRMPNATQWNHSVSHCLTVWVPNFTQNIKGTWPFNLSFQGLKSLRPCMRHSFNVSDDWRALYVMGKVSMQALSSKETGKTLFGNQVGWENCNRLQLTAW